VDSASWAPPHPTNVPSAGTANVVPLTDDVVREAGRDTAAVEAAVRFVVLGSDTSGGALRAAAGVAATCTGFATEETEVPYLLVAGGHCPCDLTIRLLDFLRHLYVCTALAPARLADVLDARAFDGVALANDVASDAGRYTATVEAAVRFVVISPEPGVGTHWAEEDAAALSEVATEQAVCPDACHIFVSFESDLQ